MNDTELLQKALELAEESVKAGGFPAGALVVLNGEVIGTGISIGNLIHDPTSHGEMAAIQDACSNKESSDLSGATLYGSLEPCSMCLSAMMWAGISRAVYAAKKDSTSSEYYGGMYRSETLNEEFLRPLVLVHEGELENESLAIVREWESKQ